MLWFVLLLSLVMLLLCCPCRLSAFDGSTGSRRLWVMQGVAILCLLLAAGGYYLIRQITGVEAWQDFNKRHQTAIITGLFAPSVVDSFMQQHQHDDRYRYCFAMQQRILRYYGDNADALAQLAHCYLQNGASDLAATAASIGLRRSPEHIELNYIAARVDYLQHHRLSLAALDHLTLTIRQAPQHFGALTLLALNSLQADNRAQAQFFLQQMRQAVGGRPDKGQQQALHDIAGRLQQLKDNE